MIAASILILALVIWLTGYRIVHAVERLQIRPVDLDSLAERLKGGK